MAGVRRRRRGDERDVRVLPAGPTRTRSINPLGGTGDSGTGLYAVIGLLAALRHRDVTGEGQFVDIAIYDSMLSLLDLAYNYWSMGVRWEPDEPRRSPGDRRLVPHRRRLRRCCRSPARTSSSGWPRCSATPSGDRAAPVRRRPVAGHLRTDRPAALEDWSKDRSNLDAARALAEAGIPAGPCYAGSQVPDDEHVKLRRSMIVEIPRTPTASN